MSSQSRWHEELLKKYKKDIVLQWIKEVKQRTEGIPIPALEQMGVNYFHLILGCHLPLEVHPRYPTILDRFTEYASAGTPLIGIIHTLHAWREPITNFLWKDDDANPLHVKDVLSCIQLRIDELQRAMISIYEKHSHTMIHNKQLILLEDIFMRMTKEMGDPLVAIQGFLQLTRAELTPAFGKQDTIENYFSVIENEFEDLYRKLLFFLSLSPKNGIMEDYVEYSNEELILDVLELLEPRLSEENIHHLFFLNCRFSLLVQKLAIVQVVCHLIHYRIDALSNLSGSKRLTLYSSEAFDQVHIHIVDNGPDIEETDLGLVICKRIMERNKGNLSYQSAKDQTILTLSFKKNSNRGI